MPCLICRYFHPIEPEQHRAARMARTDGCVQSSQFDIHDSIAYVTAHGSQRLDGYCRLNPEPFKRNCGDVCGQVAPIEREIWHHGRPTLIRTVGEKTLTQWSRETLDELINGNWRDQMHVQDYENVKTLRRQLKASRKISAARLERLKKLEAKPKKNKPDNVVEFRDAAE
jgi:hypothetical protein